MTSPGDITVLGMTMGIHMLEDLRIGVPHGMLVTIPAEQALTSRDLWRAISQRQIFRIHGGGIHAPVSVPPAAPPTSDVVPRLMEENQQLQTALAAQLAQHEAVMAQLKAQAAAIQALTQVVAAQPRVAGGPSAPATASDVDTTAPTFIPANIKPDSVEVHIETTRTESDGSDISGNRDKLRRLRQ
jgi:hypothetical protein